MSIIYSFLQKRKMHENQHGIIMVITAYVLSFIMLVLGSDLFYNINSAAAGINRDTYEGTKEILKDEILKDEILKDEILDTQTTDTSTQIVQTQLINPYGLVEITETDETAETAKTELGEVSAMGTYQSEETIWLLGSAMDSVVFDSILEQLDNFNSISDVLKTTGMTTTDTTTIEAEGTIESLSTEGTTDTSSRITNKEDISMLQRIVEAEASGEDMVGKILVANVIFNRMADEDFPDTVKGVIFQEKNGGYQFSPVADERYWSVKVSKETKEAVKRAIEGEDYSEGALYFIARKRTKASSAQWFDQKLDWLFKHGGHEFYKNK